MNQVGLFVRPQSYLIHDLSLLSDITLPELHEFSLCGRADVKVCIGSVPDQIGYIGKTTEGYFVAEDKILIKISDVGCYLVEGGDTIIVQPEKNSDPAIIRFYLLGAAFVALLFQRGAIPLHAGVVSREGRAIAILGFSMAGKSTLVGALAQRGWSALTDDRLLIRQEGALFYALPSVPVLNLAPEAARQIGYHEHTLLRPQSNFGKRLHDAKDRYGQHPSPLTALVFLEWGKQIRVKHLDSFQALVCLREQVNYESYLRLLGREDEFLRFAAELVSIVPAHRLRRPKSFDCLSDAVRAIELIR